MKTFAAGIYTTAPGHYRKEYVDHFVGITDWDSCFERLQYLAETYPQFADAINNDILMVFTKSMSVNTSVTINGVPFRIFGGIDIWNGNCPDKCPWH